MSRKVAFAAMIGVLTGCANEQPIVHSIDAGKSVGWLRHDWRVCEDEKNCPRPTPKTILLASHDVPAQTKPEAKPQESAPKQLTGPEPAKTTNNDPFVVHFNFASTTPTKAGFLELKDVLASIRQDDALRVVGYTDNLGSETYNDRLARLRAEFVATWLRRHGVKNPIRVEAKGKCCFVESNDSDTGRAANRRAVIHFLTNQKEGK